MKALLIKNLRKSILAPQARFLDALGIDHEIVSIRDMTWPELKALASVLSTQKKYRWIMFTNGTDTNDSLLSEELVRLNMRDHITFSELGWLPYQEYFYLDHYGIGSNASFSYASNNDLLDWSLEEPPNDQLFQHYKERTLTLLKNSGEESLPKSLRNYILVPLQVDGDSKMKIGSPYFSKVSKFVDWVIKTVPRDVPVVFRNHPHNKKPIPVPQKVPNVYNITGQSINKFDLIQRARSVWGINSTLLLEALLLNKHVVSLGRDVFSNKSAVRIGDPRESFEELMTGALPDTHIAKLLLQYLVERQLPRKTQIKFDFKHSYWGQRFMNG